MEVEIAAIAVQTGKQGADETIETTGVLAERTRGARKGGRTKAKARGSRKGKATLATWAVKADRFAATLATKSGM